MNWELTKHIIGKHGVGNEHGEILYKYACHATAPIVEIGSFYGRSTVCLAYGAVTNHKQTVYAIDPWNLSREGVKKEDFDRNIHAAGLSATVHSIHGFSHEVIHHLPAEIQKHGIGLIFIDGSHSYKSVKQDLDWLHYLNENGVVIFHDYGYEKTPGVKQAVDEYMNGNQWYNKEFQVGSLIGFRKTWVSSGTDL